MMLIKFSQCKSIFVGLVFFCSLYAVIYIGLVTVIVGTDNIAYKKCDVLKSNEMSVFKIPLQNNIKQWDDFQPVSNGTDMFVYSAYHDGRDKIRLIGLSLHKKSPLLCLLRYWNTSEGTETVRIVKAYVASIHAWEYFRPYRYTSVYFLCYLCGFDVPNTVSITTDIDHISNIIPVQKSVQDDVPQRQFTMCLSPLFGTIDGLRFVEWVELHRILGVEKFIMYETSTEITTINRKMLQHYIIEGVVEVFPWDKSNIIDTSLTNYIAQMAALNDCLYKSKGQSKYIAATDLDEFIIPQSDEDYTWNDMIQRLPTDSGVFIFRNTFFRRYAETKKFNHPPYGQLFTESMHFKENLVYAAEDRSKLFGRTDHIVTLDIHEINALCKGHQHVVPVDIGLLHHYREINGMYDWNNIPTVEDRTATHKYINPLRQRVGNLSKMFNIYFDPDG